MGKVVGDHATAVGVVNYLRNSMEISALTQLLTEPETFDAKLAEMRVPVSVPGPAEHMGMHDAAPGDELREASE